jgi:DNA-binding MarR family transcriptional regulator
LTRIIDGLVDKGYLTKEYNRRDSRCVNLNLSRKGKSFVKKVDTLNENVHKKVINDINVSQQKFLISGMEKLCSEVEILSGKNK